MATTKMANIFISHKTEDREIAFKLKDILQRYDKEPKMKFFLSEEIVGGELWYDKIKQNLTESNLLLLLYTDPARSWDWCLYEAGLFDRLDAKYHKRIVCLHSSKIQPPSPLIHLQAFSASPERIKEFVKQLMTGTELLDIEDPVADWLLHVEDKMDEMVTDISNLIDGNAQATKYFNKYLFIHVNDHQALTSLQIPQEAKVQSNGNSLAIFLKDYDEDMTWGEIEQKARQNEDCRWIEELATAMHQVVNKDLPAPIQANFQALNAQKTYRPLLYRADKLVDGSCKFKILFNEDVTWRLKDIPRAIGSLLTILVMSTRFRYEVINKHCDKNGKLVVHGSVKEACESIRQNIFTIENQARSRGDLNRETLLELFKVREERDEIEDMLNQWTLIRDELCGQEYPEDTQAIEKHLHELAKMNRQFLALGLECFRNVIEDERCGPTCMPC